MVNTTVDEYKLRISKLKEAVDRQGINVALLSYKTDVYYFTGTAVLSTLVIPLNHDPTLLVRLGYERALEDTWLPPDNVKASQGLRTLVDTVRELGENSVIGLCMDVMTVDLFEKLKALLPESRFKDISSSVLNTRLIKSTTEINLIKKAASISARCFHYCKSLHEGMTEIEILNEIQGIQKNAGADEGMILRHSNFIPILGIVASGPNTAVMSQPVVNISGCGTSSAYPYGASSRKLQKGDPVFIDLGVNFCGYHSDEARTCIIGKPDDTQKRLFEVILRIQDAALGKIRSGHQVSEIYNAAKKVASESNYEEYFMGYKLCGFEYVGHGLGLEIDEPPLISPKNNMELRPGMVIAIEPKIIIPSWGGIATEDTVLVTARGFEILTQTPRELVSCL